MATALQVGDLLSCRAWTALDEQGAVNTFNYEVITVAGGAVTDQDLANEFDLHAGPFYTSLLTPNGNYKGTQVYFLKRATPGPLPFPVKAVAQAGPGIASDPPTPRNTCGILKYHTVFRGPSGRGRIFLPFAASGYVANDARPTPGFDTLVNSYASILLTPFTLTSGGSSAVVAWVLLHKVKGSPPTVRGQIIGAESADKFGQMHKRGDYGKANAPPI